MLLINSQVNTSSVQSLDPCACDCEDCGYFFRSVTVWVVGAVTVVAAGVVGLHYFKFHRRQDYEDIDNVNYEQNIDDMLDE